MKKIKFISIITAVLLTLSCFAFSALADGTAVIQNEENRSADVAGSPSDTWDGTVATSFESGSGKASDPYIIKTGAQLAYFAASVNGGEKYDSQSIRLEADIDLNGSEWIPVGNAVNSFSGNFDGNGKTVSNFKIKLEDATVTNLGGFFGKLVGGKIMNLNLAKAEYTVLGPKSVAGGIVAQAQNSSIIACSTGEDVTINLTDNGSGNAAYAGGIVGVTVNSAVNIEYCTNRANVVATNTIQSVFAGGIVGLLGPQATVSWCSNYGEIETAGSVGNYCAGGIAGCVGASSSPAYIDHCINLGFIKSSQTSGGIAGRTNVSSSSISFSYSNARAYGNTDWAGLFTGRMDSWTLFESNAYCEMSETEPEGDNKVWYLERPYGTNGDKSYSISADPSTAEGQIKALSADEITPLIKQTSDKIAEGVAASLITTLPDPGDDEEITTSAPVTTQKPAETTESNTDTKEPESSAVTGAAESTESTTGDEKSSGCKGFAATGVAAVAVVASVAVALTSKKKKHD